MRDPDQGRLTYGMLGRPDVFFLLLRFKRIMLGILCQRVLSAILVHMK